METNMIKTLYDLTLKSEISATHDWYLWKSSASGFIGGPINSKQSSAMR